jgi:hypothetical protein
MEDECSSAVEKYIRSKSINILLIPPYNYQVNAAKRAIATFKEHFITALAICFAPSNFGMSFSRKSNLP